MDTSLNDSVQGWTDRHKNGLGQTFTYWYSAIIEFANNQFVGVYGRQSIDHQRSFYS